MEASDLYADGSLTLSELTAVKYYRARNQNAGSPYVQIFTMMQTRGTMFVTEAQVGALMRVTFGQVPQDLAKRSKSSLTQNSQNKLTSQVQIS